MTRELHHEVKRYSRFLQDLCWLIMGNLHWFYQAQSHHYPRLGSSERAWHSPIYFCTSCQPSIIFETMRLAVYFLSFLITAEYLWVKGQTKRLHQSPAKMKAFQMRNKTQWFSSGQTLCSYVFICLLIWILYAKLQETLSRLMDV